MTRRFFLQKISEFELSISKRKKGRIDKKKQQLKVRKTSKNELTISNSRRTFLVNDTKIQKFRDKKGNNIINNDKLLLVVFEKQSKNHQL